MDKSLNFQVTITSEHRLLDLHIRETFQYRDLIALLVKRDFITNYKQTLLGPFWAVLQPLLTTIVFTVVFGNLAGLTTADTEEAVILPGFLFYMSGNICWSYFSATLNATSGTFLSNKSVMGKVYYPRLVAPVSTAFSKLISFGIQFLILLCFWAYFIFTGTTDICVSPALLLILVCILQMMILSVGCGMVISALTTKYRDLQMLVGFGLSLWQYASPVAYGLKLIPEQYLWLYMLNPITPVITTFRYALFGIGYFNLLYGIIGLAVSFLVFFIGIILFSRTERTFMDTI